ncbi:helix-turn-helix domain-containing protein [Bengtsoniella intestinalis]|uniref:helix-turn-helix domain-containing protein n=1 Tax=Bengtsoniella intestinalis TaxID=3073143 RepID=UPI00391F9194
MNTSHNPPMDESTAEQQNNLVPLEVIKAAKQGDKDAIATICKHYEDYIIASATETYVDKAGKTHEVFDEDMASALRIRLIEAIGEFEIVEE